MASRGLRPAKRPAEPARGGKPISLSANHFAVESLPSDDIHHYDVNILPERVSKAAYSDIVQALIASNDPRLGGMRPVFDGKANMYSRRRFPFEKERTTFEVSFSSGGASPRTYQVTLKWVALVSLDILKRFLGIGPGTEQSRRQQMALVQTEEIAPAIQALDTILRHGLASRYVPVGRSYFSVADDKIRDLGGGMAVWRGFHASMRPSMWKMQLNMDVSATVFHKEMSVIDFLKEVVYDRKMKFCDVESGRWEDRDRMVLKKEVKGLKVAVTHTGYQRTHRVTDLSRQPPTAIFFKMEKDGRQVETSVSDYLKQMYGIQLRYPLIPCLQVGAKEKGTFIPMELCTIASGQRVTKKLPDAAVATMIKAITESAPERKAGIQRKFREARLNEAEGMREFGIRIGQQMISLDGRIIDPPDIRHSQQLQACRPDQGSWNYRHKRLHDPKSLQNWVLINLADVGPRQLNIFFTKLERVAAGDGLKLTANPAKYNERPIRATDMERLLVTWNEASIAAKRPIQLCFCIIPARNHMYGEFKRICDTKIGIPSQVILSQNIVKANDKTCANIVLKLNSKLGGVNFVIEPKFKHPFFKEPIIVLGADVTHPAVSNLSSPSIAAVVGSMDSFPMKYGTQMRVQDRRKEIITELQGMTRTLLMEFYRSTGRQPLRIIMYRDGVSEGQFQACLEEELRSIRRACISLDKDYRPGITFITVQKRHHTRFFCNNPRDEQGKGRNIPAGTVVDRGVAHPTEHDFFLCSHYGIQGTSRPAHYRVLWDDNKLSQDAVQLLTYHLCHTYARCARSVSIPAPAYYAHLVAFRARHLIDPLDQSDLASRVSAGSGPPRTSIEELQRALEMTPEHLKSMYFV
ncbi:protein argonaute-2-like [Sycon ciliatum]|uniref:protein argonaute-2-like n=1 Tax=Sycon ciliatum TaxID=27933 RepID=UPI0031F615EF|eukprot:scpid43678/ scgid28491/ Protein argonaute-2; Eukaryotic translation initiation factor 2C 2; Protein slicer